MLGERMLDSAFTQQMFIMWVYLYLWKVSFLDNQPQLEIFSMVLMGLLHFEHYYVPYK